MTLQYLGLSSGIEYCVRRGSERAGFKGKVRNKLKGSELDNLSKIEQVLLYRLIQESITNICKHASASNVEVNINRLDNFLVCRVIDDGRGVDLSKISNESRGVRYMRQRADLIGATIGWYPAEKGTGTMVEIRMDLTGRTNGDDSDS